MHAADSIPRAAAAPPRLGATLAACLLIAAVFVGLVARLTHGFEFWTYEELRRRAAADGQLQAPALLLRDALGQPLSAFDAEGTAPIYLVDFIYTRCPTVCQVLGNEYFRMQEALREAGPGPVRLLSISIDPAHDRQTELAAHGKLHGADPSLWAVTAPRDADAGDAALRRLGVVAVPDGFGGFVHNGTIHLIDGRGRVHRIFDYPQWPQALSAARQLARGPAP